MGASDYHFVTHWKVRGPIRTVYDILKDGENYDRWWRPAYVRTDVVGTKKVRALVRAKLPYTLDFMTELVREDPPRELEIKSTGELAGRGIWKLVQNDGSVDVTFFWDVSAEKPLVKLLSPILKPLFRWNHDWVMKTGEPQLQAEVDRRIRVS
jgi:polyketide cyclase/dehydrase/lipid transport protein